MPPSRQESEGTVLLIDFEHDLLVDMLGRRTSLNVTVSWGRSVVPTI